MPNQWYTIATISTNYNNNIEHTHAHMRFCNFVRIFCFPFSCCVVFLTYLHVCVFLFASGFRFAYFFLFLLYYTLRLKLTSLFEYRFSIRFRFHTKTWLCIFFFHTDTFIGWISGNNIYFSVQSQINMIKGSEDL